MASGSTGEGASASGGRSSPSARGVGEARIEAAGGRYAGYRERKGRPIEVERGIEVLDEGDRPSRHQGQAYALPIQVARVVDDRPALELRLVRGEVEPVGDLPYRGGDDVADGGLPRARTREADVEAAPLVVAGAEDHGKGAVEIVADAFVGKAEGLGVVEGDRAQAVFREEDDEGPRVAEVLDRLRLDGHDSPGDRVRRIDRNLGAAEPAEEVGHLRRAREVDAEALERAVDALLGGIAHGGRGGLVARAVGHDQGLEGVVDLVRGEGQGDDAVARQAAPMLEVADARGEEDDLRDGKRGGAPGRSRARGPPAAAKRGPRAPRLSRIDFMLHPPSIRELYPVNIARAAWLPLSRGTIVTFMKSVEKAKESFSTLP